MPRKREMGRAANGTGSTRKRTVVRNGKEYTYWQGRYTAGYDPGTGKQIQHSISGSTQKEVTQKLKEVTHELDQGTYLAPNRMKVKDWLEIWKAEYTGDVKESTAYIYKKDLDMYVIPFLGATKLEALTTDKIQQLYGKLLKPEKAGVKALSAKSVRNVHGVLHKALQQAVLNGYIRNNPADACKPPKVVKKEIAPLDTDHIKEFLRVIQGHPHEYLYQIALFTGLREGEVLGLTWDCLDFESGTLLVKQQLRRQQQKGGTYYMDSTKNGKCRVLKLAPSVVRLFLRQKQKQDCQRLKAGDLWEENNLIFSNNAGSFLSYRTVYDCFKRVMATIGSRTTRFHDLRHTYAVLAIKNGDDIKTVQENLGHATAAFTLDVYGHVTRQMRQNSADRMEEVIKSVSTNNFLPSNKDKNKDKHNS